MTTQQTQRFGDHAIRFVGDLAGKPYSVMVDLDAQTAIWEADQVPRPTAKTPTKAGGKKPCLGCENGVHKLLRGGWGWARTLFKKQASPETIRAREEICERCPSDCYHFGVCRDDWPDRSPREQGCGCILSLKVLIEDEKCPHKHW